MKKSIYKIVDRRRYNENSDNWRYRKDRFSKYDDGALTESQRRSRLDRIKKAHKELEAKDVKD